MDRFELEFSSPQLPWLVGVEDDESIKVHRRPEGVYFEAGSLWSPGGGDLPEGRYALAILSYNPAKPSASLAEREGHAWVNHLDVMALEEKFGAAGFVVVERRAFEAIQLLWKLRGK